MITQDRLKELLTYDPESGILLWNKNMKGPARAGSPAGYRRNDGYVEIKIDGQKQYAHRLAWIYLHGEIDGYEIDHIDHDPSNNRASNLRSVASQGNNMNRSIGMRNYSGVMGVFWAKHANKWAAQIRHDRKTKHLGYFSSIEQAKIAREAAEKGLGFHENHGRKMQ